MAIIPLSISKDKHKPNNMENLCNHSLAQVSHCKINQAVMHVCILNFHKYLTLLNKKLGTHIDRSWTQATSACASGAVAKGDGLESMYS